MWSSTCKNIEVVLHFLKYFGHLPFTKDLRCLPFSKSFSKYLRSSFIFQNKMRCLPLEKTLRSSSICQNIEVVFHLWKNLGRLPFSKILRSSSICQNIEVVFLFLKIKLSSNIQKFKVVFHFPKIEVVFHLLKNWGRLLFVQKNWGRLPIWILMHSCMVIWSSFADFQLFHYYSGWPAGRPAGRMLDIAKLKLTSA